MKITRKESKLIIEIDLQELVDGENNFYKDKSINNSSENKYKGLRKGTIDFLQHLEAKYKEKEIILKSKEVIDSVFKFRVLDYMQVIRREVQNGRLEVVRYSDTKRKVIVSVRFLSV